MSPAGSLPDASPVGIRPPGLEGLRVAWKLPQPEEEKRQIALAATTRILKIMRLMQQGGEPATLEASGMSAKDVLARRTQLREAPPGSLNRADSSRVEAVNRVLKARALHGVAETESVARMTDRQRMILSQKKHLNRRENLESFGTGMTVHRRYALDCLAAVNQQLQEPSKE